MGYAHAALRDAQTKYNWPPPPSNSMRPQKLKPTEAKIWTELGGMLYMSGDLTALAGGVGAGPAIGRRFPLEIGI